MSNILQNARLAGGEIGEKMNTPSKADIARGRRYKKPALASMNFHDIQSDLGDMSEIAEEIAWYESQGEETLTQAIGGDEEEAYEFRIAFADVSGRLYQLSEAFQNLDLGEDEFNYCTSALLGNRYSLIGFDSVEEDYYSLTNYEEGLAATAAGEWLCRKTKKEMLSLIGQCMGLLMAYHDLRLQFDNLRDTLDVLRGSNLSILATIKEIERLYEEAERYPYGEDVYRLNFLLEEIPQEMWVE